MRRARACLACLVMLFWGLAAFAQTQGAIQPSPVLTLNQERLYQQSDFGKRVQEEITDASRVLQQENQRIQADLIAEEQRLTDERPAMEVEAFQELAADFDTRVVSIRAAQDEKADAIRARAEAERTRFFELAFPVLFALVEDTGAVAILNSAAVIFSVRQIDITDRAIARVNQEIGASPLPREGPSPLQRPSGFGEPQTDGVSDDILLSPGIDPSAEPATPDD